jgi:hypothetical protein
MPSDRARARARAKCKFKVLWVIYVKWQQAMGTGHGSSRSSGIRAAAMGKWHTGIGLTGHTGIGVTGHTGNVCMGITGIQAMYICATGTWATRLPQNGHQQTAKHMTSVWKGSESQLPALLKHAETLYKEYLHTDRWLQTKKRGSGFTAAATDAAAAAPAAASASTPQANAAPRTECRGGKKTRAPPAPWRLIPPGPGEPPKKLDENGKVVWWCKECKLWNWSHDTKNHKSPEDLKAERAAKKTSAKSNESAPRSARFSDGSVELRND